jgi:hypothetical protein
MCRLDAPDARRACPRPAAKLPVTPDATFLMIRERARVDALRAEDPVGWERVLGLPVRPLDLTARRRAW